MEKEKIATSNKTNITLLPVLQGTAAIFSIGNTTYDFFNVQKIQDKKSRRQKEFLKWQNEIPLKLDSIEDLLIEVNDSLSIILQTISAEFDKYIKSSLIASIRVVSSKYAEWSDILKNGTPDQKEIVLKAIDQESRQLLHDTYAAFHYGYSFYDSIAMSLMTQVSLYDLANWDKKGLDNIYDEFTNYFNACLDSKNKNSITYKLNQMHYGSDITAKQFWQVNSLVQAKTYIEKYLVTIENLKNPGIQISVNYGFVRIGNYDVNKNGLSIIKVLWYLRPQMIGSRIDINVLGNNLGGEVVTSNTKVIRIVAIDQNQSNSVYYEGTFFEDLGWEDLCDNVFNKVQKINFEDKLVLAIISGAHAYQFPTPELANWLNKLGATLKEWKTQTDASGPSDAICYYCLGEYSETPRPIIEKFVSNWYHGHHYSYLNLESYMLRANYNHPLETS